MEIKLHTVFVLVGPTNCGKSYFANKLKEKISIETDGFANTQIISSDAIRRELLGKDLGKYDKRMLYSSAEAFKLLFTKLKAVTSYPINSEFVIVDTTGLSDSFRDSVIKIVKENHYNSAIVLFDYKNNEEYLKYADENTNNKFLHKQISKFKRGFPNFKVRSYDDVFKIKSFDDFEFDLEIQDWEKYASCHIDDDAERVIIGDVHGCYNELVELCVLNKAVIEDGLITGYTDDRRRKFLLVGDYIDKGPQILETIEFIYNNKDHFDIVVGNHERFVIDYFVDPSKVTTSAEVIEKYFSTIQLLKDSDPIYLSMLVLLYAKSKPFYKANDYIVTHAPCLNKYLGKLDDESIKFQSNMRVVDRTIPGVEACFQPIKDESSFNQPYHIFGHFAFQNKFKSHNKLCIDTGCVHGGKLTSVIVNDYNNLFLQEIKCKETYFFDDRCPDIFVNAKERDIDLNRLDHKEITRLKFLGKEKVNFISGTVSPSDKNKESLESLETAIEYYRTNGCAKIVLQPKYMGSRCNVYLHKDVEQSYAVSRGGYKIKKNDELLNVFKSMYEFQKDDFEKNNIKIRIIDSELMPWRFLGAGLIDYQFKLFGHATRSEFESLDRLGFAEELNKLKEEIKSVDFASLKNIKNKKELTKLFGQSKYNTYKEEAAVKSFDIKENLGLMDIYDEQMRLFGEDCEVHVKPFSILKEIYNDDSEQVLIAEGVKNEELFRAVSDDEICVVDLSDESSIKAGYEFYDAVTKNKKMEGIVVKPEFVYMEGVAPYLKVRNPNYLTIVYGYDYLTDRKFSKLLAQKSIRRKLRVSIKEWELGKKMLEFPYSELSFDNKSFVNTAAALILETKSEETIDPRL